MGNTPTLSIWPMLPTVHPHTHGEHLLRAADYAPGYGSSPHAWGTPHNPLMQTQPVRFIPTRMGNTSAPCMWDLTSPVHPHTHGEHLPRKYHLDGSPGSSPHAWGTHGESFEEEKILRFIPTRMGNTYKTVDCIDYISVHPHTHGEHFVMSFFPLLKTGSSPHAWGTLDGRGDALAGLRFIPTRMGNTNDLT